MPLLPMELLIYAYSLDITLITVDCLLQMVSSLLYPQEAGIGRPQVVVLIVCESCSDSSLVEAQALNIHLTIFLLLFRLKSIPSLLPEMILY